VRKKQHPRLRRSDRYDSPEDARRELVRCGYMDTFVPPGWPAQWTRTGKDAPFAVAQGARKWRIVPYPETGPWVTTPDLDELLDAAEEQERLNDWSEPSSTVHEPYERETPEPTICGAGNETGKSII